MNAEELGNDHGLKCPRCKEGDGLSIQVLRWACLLPDGTDDEPGDTEWDDNSDAQCTCGWSGKVKEMIVIELDDDDDSDDDEEEETEDADPELS